MTSSKFPYIGMATGDYRGSLTRKCSKGLPVFLQTNVSVEATRKNMTLDDIIAFPKCVQNIINEAILRQINMISNKETSQI